MGENNLNKLDNLEIMKFIRDENRLYNHNLSKFDDMVRLFDRVDNIFGNVYDAWKGKFRDDYTLILGNLFRQTQRYFYNALLLTLRGQIPIYLSVIRGAIESTGQAYLIHKNNDLVYIWLKACHSKNDNKKFRDTFCSANMFPESGPLMIDLKEDYRISCNYGAHAGLGSTTLTFAKINDGFDMRFFVEDSREITRHLIFSLSVAVRLLNAHAEFLKDIIDTSDIKKKIDKLKGELTLKGSEFKSEEYEKEQ